MIYIALLDRRGSGLIWFCYSYVAPRGVCFPRTKESKLEEGQTGYG